MITFNFIARRSLQEEFMYEMNVNGTTYSGTIAIDSRNKILSKREQRIVSEYLLNSYITELQTDLKTMKKAISKIYGK